MTVMNEEVFNYSSLKVGGPAYPQGHMEKHQGWSGVKKSEGNRWATTSIVVSAGKSM